MKNKTWDEVMNDFRKFPECIQDIIKRAAVKKLILDGAEEVGSSDQWHSVYNLHGVAWELREGINRWVDYEYLMEISEEYERFRPSENY